MKLLLLVIFLSSLLSIPVESREIEKPLEFNKFIEDFSHLSIDERLDAIQRGLDEQSSDFLNMKIELRGNIITSVSKALSQHVTFGTSGWREARGKGFNPFFISVVFWAITQYLDETNYPKDKYFLMGFDTRKMGYEAVRIGARIVASHGYKVLIPKSDNMYLSTPQMSYMIYLGKIPGLDLQIGNGAYITASHNEEGDNGLKTYGRQGGVAPKSITDGISAHIKTFPNHLKNGKNLSEIKSFDQLLASKKIVQFDNKDIYIPFVNHVIKAQGNLSELKTYPIPHFDALRGSTTKGIIHFLSLLGVKKENIDNYILHRNAQMPPGYHPNPDFKHSQAARLWAIQDALTLSDGLTFKGLNEKQIDLLARGREVSLSTGDKFSFIKSAAESLDALFENRLIRVRVNGQIKEIRIISYDKKAQKMVIMMDNDGDRLSFYQGESYIDPNMATSILTYVMVNKVLNEFNQISDISELKDKYKKFLEIDGNEFIFHIGRTIGTTHLIDAIVDHFNKDPRRKTAYAPLTFKLDEVKVGFKNFVDMYRSLICGESSAHLAIDDITYDDAFKVGITIWSLMHKMKIKSLSDLYKKIQKEVGHQTTLIEEMVVYENHKKKQEIEDRINNAQTIIKDLNSILKEARLLKSFKLVKEKDDPHRKLDGIRLLFKETTWIEMRMSGTEAVGRFYIEAIDKQQASLLKEMAHYLMKNPHKIDKIDLKKAIRAFKKKNITKIGSKILTPSLAISNEDQEELQTFLELDDLNMLYYKGLLNKARSAQSSKPISIYDGKTPISDDHLKVYTTANAPDELMEHIPYVQYKDINEDKKNALAAQSATLWFRPMHAGIGSSVGRSKYLSKIKGIPEKEVVLGAKGTDLYINSKKEDGSYHQISLAEIQIIRAIRDVEKRKIFSKVIFHNLIGSETKKSLDKIWPINSSYKGQTVDHFGSSFQARLPSLNQKGQMSLNRTAPGGHGIWGVDSLRAAFLDSLKPKDVQGPLVAVVGNGEDLSSMPSESMVGFMIRNNIPIVMVTTEKTELDKKGGVISLILDGEFVYVSIVETAQAKSSGQLELFENLGLRNGDKQAFFNTNMAIFNYQALTPKIKSLVEEIGEDEFMKIITPDLILNKKDQIDWDGVKRTYTQLEGAMGSVLLNLDKYWRKHKGEPLVHIINVKAKERTNFFSPIKKTFDYFMQFHTDRFTFDFDIMRLKNNRPGKLPKVNLNDDYYNEVDNVLTSFEGASLIDLDELFIDGKVAFKGASLHGKVVINNRSGSLIDLNTISSLPKEGGKLILKNIHITFDENSKLTIR